MHRIMTDSATRPTRRRWLRVTIGLTMALLVIGGALAWNADRRDVRRQALATEVIRAGGVLEYPKTLLESFQVWRKNGKLPRRKTIAQLSGATFDNRWIREHDYLADFDFWFLQCDSITGDDLAKLIDTHPLEILNARNIVLTEEVLRAIREKASLRQVLLGKSKYTDEQLAGLPLERLDTLSLAFCGVTVAGLQHVKRCRNLESISLDGSQVTAETADLLASLGTVNAVHVWGPEVTDSHLEHLGRIMSLTTVVAYGTSVTEQGRAALAAELPRCAVKLERWAPD